MTDYWNHNTAYHRWIAHTVARRGHQDLLDVGCGDGLLLERQAPMMRSVTGIEPDLTMFTRAEHRLAPVPNATLVRCDFADYTPSPARFDLVAFVASLHHLPLRASLAHAAALLRPGGDLLVVGLAADKSPLDWAFSGLSLPLVRLGSFLHHETRDIGAPVAQPQENLAEIREVVAVTLPGAHIRRGLYYRYLLRWTKPLTS